jgi:putative heme-binding domain-containing protein
MMPVLFVCLCWLALLPSVCWAQRDLTTIPPPDPELERKTFMLPEGFEVNLFAADPQIAKPIQINFDAQGRLWLVSSRTYPQIHPEGQASDRVLVLEDEDGDGVSDRTRVFADNLLIPTGVAPGDGGAYVAAGTEILHLSDKDGDGKADTRRIVVGGFGTEDTHHLIHTFCWGPEQHLYFNQSVYIHSHVETPWGVRRLNAGGIWRFRPAYTRLDVFARGLYNPWGLAFDDYGTTFATDGAGREGINYVVPGAAYVTAYGAERMLSGLNPGSPKHCGLEIIGSRHLPDDWQGNVVTCDFRGHRVCRFVLTGSGAGFFSREQQDIIKSAHVAFRPVDVKVGPDGALYIADWYNPIIQHGEVDFRDPRRDHTHGRIWRVTYQANPLVIPPDLASATDDELASQLASPERLTRQQAKRLLKERGPGVLPAVKRWARGLDNTAEGYHQRRLEALWVYQSLDVVEPELLVSLLRCIDPQARAAAARIVGDWHARLDEPIALLEARATDEHPRVRLEAVRALACIPDAHAIEVAMRAFDPDVPSYSAFMPLEVRQANQPQQKRVEVDEWLDYVLWLTARDLRPVWEPALLSGEIDFDGNVRHLIYVLKSAGSAELVPVLTQLLRDGRVTDDERHEVVDVITAFGGPTELGELLDLAVAANDEHAAGILLSLLQSFERRRVAPAGEKHPLDQLVASRNHNVRNLAIRCAGAWRIARLWPSVRAILQSDREVLETRIAAIASATSYGGEEATGLLTTLAARRDGESLEIRSTAIQALLRLDVDFAVVAAIGLMQQTRQAERLAPLCEAIVQQRAAIDGLTTALAGQSIPSDAAVVALRVVESSGQSLPELSAALQAAGNVRGGPKQLSPRGMQLLVAEIESAGDPAAGERIYRRQELNCVKCHAIGGAGGNVGPDFISLGASAPLDYLVDALLDPNKQIKESYRTQVVLTDEGLTRSGILVRETDDALILRDAEGREQHVPLDAIEIRQDGASLMPAGLSDQLTRAELVDLVAFLKALGRLPEYTIGTEPIARRWQTLHPTDDAVRRLHHGGEELAAVDGEALPWQTVYSRVNGSIPLDDLPVIRIGDRHVRIVRLTLFSANPNTPAALQLNTTQEMTGWWNGQPLELGTTIPVTLDKGVNRLTLKVDASRQGPDLRIGLADAVPGVRFGP